MTDILPSISKRIKILGQNWRLRFVRYPELGKKTAGDCQVSTKTIRVATDMKGPKTLDTIIHEMLHASQWCLSEEHVCALATDITRTILRPEIRAYWDR